MKKIDRRTEEKLLKVFGSNKPVLYNFLMEMDETDNRIFVNYHVSKKRQSSKVISESFYKPISRCFNE